MNKLVAAALACFAIMSLPVGAQGFMPWTDVMVEADTDGSGGVSMEEIKNYRLGTRFQGFQPWMTDHFAELDTDGDGEVSMSELKKGSMGMEMGDSDLSTGFYRGFGFMPANQ